MSPINNNIIILNKYIFILINVKRVKLIIKIWSVNIKIYDLLLSITWIR